MINRKKGQIFLTEEFHMIKLERMMEIENHEWDVAVVTTAGKIHL